MSKQSSLCHPLQEQRAVLENETLRRQANQTFIVPWTIVAFFALHDLISENLVSCINMKCRLKSLEPLSHQPVPRPHFVSSTIQQWKRATLPLRKVPEVLKQHAMVVLQMKTQTPPCSWGSLFSLNFFPPVVLVDYFQFHPLIYSIMNLIELFVRLATIVLIPRPPPPPLLLLSWVGI